MGLFAAKKRILIVDDDSDTLTILKSLLEKRQYKVVTAVTGEEGIKRVKEVKPDLILMDINMPGLRGDMAALRIRGEVTTKYIPIVLLTGVDDFQEKVLASQAGIVDYVTKPYDLEKLLGKIESLIAQAKLAG